MPGGYNALMAYPPRDKEDSSFSFFDSEVKPGTRGTIFPAAQYDDGKYHLAWPGLIAQPIEGFNRMWERGDEANITNPDALAQSSRESFDAAGLAATGGLAAGMVGAVPEGAVAANGIGKIRTYRGALYPETPELVAQKGQVWSSTDPAVAGKYAEGRGEISPVMYPLDIEFSNPMVIDAGGKHFSEVPYNGGSKITDQIVDELRRAGEHDGVLFNNLVEHYDQNGNVPTDNLATTAVALKPGTVRSATTGDLLYSNSPNAASVPLALNGGASPLAFTDQQNALMPSSLSKKEKDHHSLTQNRTASGQFTR